MTTALPDISVDFKAWLEESVPCDQCDRPAKLRSFGHVPVDCTGEAHLKCLPCFLAWRNDVQSLIDECDGVSCEECEETFFTTDTFSNYREF